MASEGNGAPYEDSDGFYPLTSEPDQALPHGFPLPALLSREGSDCTHVGPEGWTGYWPPEDSAVAPDFEWTEAHRLLVTHAVQLYQGGLLADNETLEVTWPPTASLWTDGVVSTSLVCVAHGDEDCEDCDEFEEVATEIKPAEWRWSVAIETYAWNGTSGALERAERFQFLTTRMDPREVGYRS